MTVAVGVGVALGKDGGIVGKSVGVTGNTGGVKVGGTMTMGVKVGGGGRKVFVGAWVGGR
jgi:hypothetical protein